MSKSRGVLESKCLLHSPQLQDSVLKAFMESVEGIVNFELTMDALNKTQNRGFGFATFDTVESCKAAHDKYYKDKLKIMVSITVVVLPSVEPQFPKGGG